MLRFNNKDKKKEYLKECLEVVKTKYPKYNQIIEFDNWVETIYNCDSNVMVQTQITKSTIYI